MKRIVFAPFLLGLIPSTLLIFNSSAYAKETCNFVSEYYPDVSIKVSTEWGSQARGTIRYKNKEVLNFQTGISNGYGGQYFSISQIKGERIAWGSAVSFIGNQSGRGTPKKLQKDGKKKLFFPRFGRGYYYSLADNEPDGRFTGRTEEMNNILGAAEGFFIPDKLCEKYIYYGW